VIMLGLIWHY